MVFGYAQCSSPAAADDARRDHRPYQEIELCLPADEHLVTESRRRTLSVLSTWGVDSATSADAVICVDRLMRETSAHVGESITLRLTNDVSRIRVDVTRRFVGIDHRLTWRPSESFAGNESGLGDVGRLACRWGTSCEADQAVTWFEVPVSQPTSASSGAPELERPSARTMIPIERTVSRLSGSGDVLTRGSLQINLITRSAEVEHADQPVRLTGREFELLMHLMHNEGSVQSRRDLLRAVWGIDFDADTAVVEVTISRLRRKLNLVDLKTIKDMGYVFGELRGHRTQPGDAHASATA